MCICNVIRKCDMTDLESGGHGLQRESSVSNHHYQFSPRGAHECTCASLCVCWCLCVFACVCTFVFNAKVFGHSLCV